MAKFFLKKGKNDKRPMHSQVVGIAWISIALLFIASLAIFLPHKDKSTIESDSTSAISVTFLEQKEDSVYHSRRQIYHKSQRYRQQTSNNTERFDTVQPMKRQPLMVELNSADTLTLQLLYGIGPAFARRIVAYRERLGGFYDKKQLLEVHGFTPKMLSKIASCITIDSSALVTLPINTIPLKQLIKHPYVEYYQARDIVRLRERGQRFATADDLRAVPSMSDSTLQRLLPYISFE